MIIFILLKPHSELWNEKIITEQNENQFNEEIEQLEKINITIKQSIDFYEKLGGERIENNQSINNNNIRKKKGRKKAKTNVDY